MKKKKLQLKKSVLTAGLAVFLSVISSGFAFAAPQSYGPAWEIENHYNGDVNTLKAAASTNQLIVAIGNPEDPAKSVLSYYNRDESGLLKQVFSVEAVSGMNGITEQKAEGDMRTPAGVYSFISAFGTKENPGSILPYSQVKKGDHFVDDSSSRYYNRYVNENEVEKDWNSSESLEGQSPHYNYALVLNYNADYVPGKGSAIFVHCPKSSNNTGTSGCISIPEEYMKQLIRTVDGNAKIVIVQEEKDLAKY